jgi:hypothetical protein
VETAKIPLATLDADLLDQMETEVLIRLNSKYDISVWTDETNTPSIVQVIIAKKYASFHIDRAYSENQDVGNDYAAKLDSNAEMLIQGLINGSFEIEPPDSPDNPNNASFYPTDASSAQTPTNDSIETMSFGGPHFGLGRVF